jgi:ATP-binding cassette subfamily B protein
MAAQASGGALTPVTTGVLDIGRAVIAALSLTATLFVLSPVMTGIVLVVAGRPPADLLQPADHRLQAVKEIRLFGLGDFFKTRLLAELRDVQAGERYLDRRVLRVQFLLVALSAAVTGGRIVERGGHAELMSARGPELEQFRVAH